jgi:hypothetical protein
MQALSRFIKECSDGLKEFEKDLIIIAGYMAGSRAGAALGGLIGGIIGGPAGAVTGAALGSTIGGLIGLGAGIYGASQVGNEAAVSGAPGQGANWITDKNQVNTPTAWNKAPPLGQVVKKIFNSLGEWIEGTASAAEFHYKLPPGSMKALIEAESSNNPNAVPRDPKTGKLLSSAKGLTQLTDATAKHVGVTNPFDPFQSIEGGSRYLHEMMQRFHGDLRRSLMAYYAGPGGGTPLAAQNYADKVLRIMARNQGSTVNHGDVHIGNITVQSTSGRPEDHGKAILKVIDQALAKRGQRNEIEAGNIYR